MMYEGMRTKMLLEVCAFVGHDRPEEWEALPQHLRMLGLAAFCAAKRPTGPLLEEIVREATILKEVDELTEAISEP